MEFIINELEVKNLFTIHHYYSPISDSSLSFAVHEGDIITLYYTTMGFYFLEYNSDTFYKEDLITTVDEIKNNCSVK